MNVTFGGILLKLQTEAYRKLYNAKFANRRWTSWKSGGKDHNLGSPSNDSSAPLGTGDRIDADHL